MTGKEIQKQIQFASQVVGQWPAWKRNILVHSSQPTNSAARPPIQNQSAGFSLGRRSAGGERGAEDADQAGGEAAAAGTQQREEPLVHPSVESPSHRLIAETLQRARASVAQQREEDDEKPIDGLWLATLGPLKKGDYELQISVDGYCAWWHGDRGMYLCHVHTRGQVRRLLEALGIWEAQPDQGKAI